MGLFEWDSPGTGRRCLKVQHYYPIRVSSYAEISIESTLKSVELEMMRIEPKMIIKLKQ